MHLDNQCTDKIGPLQTVVDLSDINKIIYLQAFDSCCWGVNSPVPLFPCIPMHTLSNGLKYRPSSCRWRGHRWQVVPRFLSRVECFFAETLTSSWSALHVLSVTLSPRVKPFYDAVSPSQTTSNAPWTLVVWCEKCHGRGRHNSKALLHLCNWILNNTVQLFLRYRNSTNGFKRASFSDVFIRAHMHM